MRSCLSVCPSVTLVDHKNHVWNSSDITSRTISFGFKVSADPNIMDLLEREQPEILAGKLSRWEKIGDWRPLTITMQYAVPTGFSHIEIYTASRGFPATARISCFTYHGQF